MPTHSDPDSPSSKEDRTPETIEDCAETLQQLYGYLDQVLDEEMRASMDVHLAGCSDCKERVEFEYSLKVHLRTRAREEPIPDELRARLLGCFEIDIDTD